jgi:hypothetical protein
MSAIPQFSPYAATGPYITSLTPQEEFQFHQWIQQYNIPWQNSPTADYDMRGYWKALQGGDPQMVSDWQGWQKLKALGSTPHFPDTWKTPYHKTFSNESIYATADAPHWSDDDKLIPTTPAPELRGP